MNIQTAGAKIKVLHYVNQWSEQGGVETYLRHVIHHIDRNRFTFDFFIPASGSSLEGLESDLQIYGGRLIPARYSSRHPRFGHEFRNALKQYGPYQIVHAHNSHMAGPALYQAYFSGVSVRISHAHNDLSRIYEKARLFQRWYYQYMKSLVLQYSTVGVGVSASSAASLYGPNWEMDTRWRIIHYGIDLMPFCEPVNPEAIRAEFDIPKQAFVVGHVGRFHEQKNHAAFVDIASEIAQGDPDIYFLLVGDGALRNEIEHKVAQLGLSNRFRFAGTRLDVPRLMKGAMDCLLFPSLYEGLPLVILEAQASGLPCIIADTISPEVEVLPHLIQRVPLSAPVVEWAQGIRSIHGGQIDAARSQAFREFEQSSFNIVHALRNLETLYERSLIGEGHTQ